MTVQQIVTRYGKLFIPDTDYAQFEWLVTTGASSEDEYITVVSDLLRERPSGIFVDAGANFGCWTLALAPLCTRVISFEPQLVVSELLLKSVWANKLTTVSVVPLALGAESGLAKLAQLDLSQRTNFGGLSLERVLEDQPNAPMGSVAVAPLDEFMESHEKVSFIKIDVEGWEPAVLRGAQRTIRQNRPLLFVEIQHRFSDAAALTAQIQALGYVTEQLGPNLLCMPIELEVGAST